MEIKDLKIGQHVTLEHWFKRREGDDVTHLTGDVVKNLGGGSMVIYVTSDEVGPFEGRNLLIREGTTRVLSIN